ncbi:photosystem II protein Psb27 [Gloeocapsa sp. PCC 73106]|uniref:photosystem II protein Psb27 n=1 Tax=Gloeocapsa sp. PCC 73106 TaxID=102232 RepID=UPI0002AC14BA|nr:photosystem II protein Psb27 [Gloeocapsa sp. PCC 73106]ELR98035.1 photosystem II protein Psb27 [Gloeocapsa sp. PCC 73106]
MSISSYVSRLLALVLVVVIGLTGCSTPTGLTGNYSQDTLAVLDNLRTAIAIEDNATNKAEVQSLARLQINDYISRYRREPKSSGLRSFTTMQTAMNALAGYYTSYGSRPLPEKLKNRLEQEFQQVELSIKRGV